MNPTSAEKAARLLELGWTRVSSYGAQSWRHPTRTGSWTLAAAWLQAQRDANAD